MSGWPARVETVLLDAGGVLLDLDYGYLRRLVEVDHPPVTEAELSRQEAIARNEINRQVRGGESAGDRWRDYFRFILRGIGIPAAEQEPLIDSLWQAHERSGLWTVPIAGGPEAVAELRRRGFRVAVVSNSEGNVERDLETAGYGGLFETVVDSHLVGVAKPDPAIFGIALERLGVGPDHAIYLGDVPALDVEGARAAGLAPVLLDRHDLYGDLDVPRLRSIKELVARLELV